MYAATGGPNVKWGGTDFKCGSRAPLAPPLATVLIWYRPNSFRSWDFPVATILLLSWDASSCVYTWTEFEPHSVFISQDASALNTTTDGAWVKIQDKHCRVNIFSKQTVPKQTMLVYRYSRKNCLLYFYFTAVKIKQRLHCWQWLKCKILVCWKCHSTSVNLYWMRALKPIVKETKWLISTW